MRPTFIRTPLIESSWLSSTFKGQVLLKMEASQPTGSFKDRGMSALCIEHVAAGKEMFYCSSGGNAGLALARAARLQGGRARVCVPEPSSAHMLTKIASEGAEVVAHGIDWAEADRFLRAWMSHDAQGVYVSPYDDPFLWRGHASLISELYEQCPTKPSALVLSVGGGGLLTGVAQGLRQVGWSDVPIVAVETEGAASFAAALEAGHPVELPAITSIATSLGARSVTSAALQAAKKQPVHSVTVTDYEAVSACRTFLDAHATLVEPACGASFAALEHWDLPRTGGPVVCIVCGGSNVTAQQLRTWEERLGVS